MAKSVLVRVSLVRAALLGATALALFSAPFTVGDAAAKVGVTSATDGDPLGKPPQEAERVLRIGIDVQANELITTNANDRAHLVFLDGSSLTVGPNAQLTIDKFVFDPTTKTGELAINASKGVLRLVGGKISKNNAITITTPSSTIGIRGGITIMDVSASKTDSTFVFGKDMTVTGRRPDPGRDAAGLDDRHQPRQPARHADAPGPGRPQCAARRSRRPARAAGRRRRQAAADATPTRSPRAPDFSGINSSQSVRIIAPGVPDNFGSGPGPRNRNPNDTVVTALSNANQAVTTTTAVQEVLQQLQQQQQQQQQAQTPAPPLPPPPTQVPTAGPGTAIRTAAAKTLSRPSICRIPGPRHTSAA